VLTITLQVATQGAESVVHDCLVVSRGAPATDDTKHASAVLGCIAPPAVGTGLYCTVLIVCHQVRVFGLQVHRPKQFNSPFN